MVVASNSGENGWRQREKTKCRCAAVPPERL